MITHRYIVAVAVAFVVAAGAGIHAQDARPQAALKIQIVISRYQGDKKVSSVPYTLSVNANMGNRSSIRMGADVPFGTRTVTSKEGVTTTSTDYRSVGTNIDCSSNMLTEGRYNLAINIEDTSVYPNAQGTVVPNSVTLPADLGKVITFRHFSASENVILRDGQSSEFTVATDKFTGEVVKADITLTVVK